MPWGKLDDKFHRHPKVKRAIKLGGKAAIGLHALALSFCNDESTDGFVPADFVGRDTRLAQSLVDAINPLKPGEPGMWEPVDGGWMIHDFLKHNPSAASVKERREEARVRVNNARTVRKQKANNSRTVREHNENTSRSSQNVRSTPVPVPVPVLNPLPKEIKAVQYSKVMFTPDGFEVPGRLLDQWGKAYPFSDVLGEIRRAHAWAVANPRKHKDNWNRFLVNWFARAHDRAPGNGTPPSRAAPSLEHRAAGITAAVKRMREEGKIP